MRTAFPAIMLLLALGCERAPVIVTATEDGRVVSAHRPSIALDPSSAAALDPWLDGFDAVELRFTVEHATAASCTVSLSRDGAVVRTLDGALTADACVARWDGRDAAGRRVSPGMVEATATVARFGDEASISTTVEVLRLGVAAVALAGDGRVPLLYPRTDGVRYGYFVVEADEVPWRLGPDTAEVGGTPLEHADGTPRERPAIWEDLGSPPLDGASADGLERDTLNLPVAYVAGSEVEVHVVLTTAHTAGIADPETVEVRLAAPEGLTVVDGEPVADGARVSLTSTASPVPAVGRYDVEWAWRFEARRPGGEWVVLPGAFTTTHRLYGLVAAPIFDYDDIPHRAWVDVVDRVTGWVDGASADPDAVAAAIVEGVFFELGLQYDSERGASHYTDYPGGWEGARFELSRFADLSNGHIVNCSDAASIVSTYANMMGIDLRYHIIQHEWRDRFQLNYLYAIGRDFARSPFTSGRSAFRYHAVVGPPDTRVFDATLALDGDGAPDAPPHELLLVQGLSELDYLQGLSPEWDRVRVFVDEKVRVR